MFESGSTVWVTLQMDFMVPEFKNPTIAQGRNGQLLKFMDVVFT